MSEYTYSTVVDPFVVSYSRGRLFLSRALSSVVLPRGVVASHHFFFPAPFFTPPFAPSFPAAPFLKCAPGPGAFALASCSFGVNSGSPSASAASIRKHVCPTPQLRVIVHTKRRRGGVQRRQGWS